MTLPSPSGSPPSDVGIVVIGRNEGARLVRCLDSLPRLPGRVVYVDSASTDRSVALARERGALVVELDMSVPFTAARARNAGWQRLVEASPSVTSVLFVDGDCEVMHGFLEAALAVMLGSPDVAAVCGWRRERHPERSAYNTVCDVEWRMGLVGTARTFGGDVLIRVNALREVGGYDETVIAAEDGELGVRLRGRGGRIVRIDRVSTLHDADMTEFRQWWRRATRCGHGYAQVSDLHGAPPERFFARELKKTFIWGAGVPGIAALLAPPTLGLSLGLFATYPVRAARVYRNARGRGFTPWESGCWAASCTVSAFPEVVGALTYRLTKLRRRRPTIIEYKRGPEAGA